MKIIATILAALAFTVSAAAQNRTIDFTQEIKGLNGEPFTQPITNKPNTKPENLTLGDVTVNALETPVPDDIKLSGEDKFKMDLLARKVYKAKAVALTPDEIKTIKDRIGKIYAATVVGAAWRLLDPEAAK